MIYLRNFTFPTESQEYEFLHPPTSDFVYTDRRAQSHNGSFYPFKILSQNDFCEVSFDSITIFYGGNGCGKTTALNVIAEKLKLHRENLFNSGRFFEDYLNMCSYTLKDDEDFETSDAFARRRTGHEVRVPVPLGSMIITSDDVFAHSMKQRDYNEKLRLQREDLERKHNSLVNSDSHLRSLEDYDRWKLRREAIKSKSKFMKDHMDKEAEEHSNGETAMLYFVDKMEKEGLYLLDEPENSLSMNNQLKLAEYIFSSARHFDCQFIIATHSPIFLSLQGAKIYDLDENPVCMKSWTELESVRTMYDFFKSHEKEFE